MPASPKPVAAMLPTTLPRSRLVVKAAATPPPAAAAIRPEALVLRVMALSRNESPGVGATSRPLATTARPTLSTTRCIDPTPSSNTPRTSRTTQQVMAMNTPETENEPYRRGQLCASVTLSGLSSSTSLGQASWLQSAWQAAQPGSPGFCGIGAPMVWWYSQRNGFCRTSSDCDTTSDAPVKKLQTPSGTTPNGPHDESSMCTLRPAATGRVSIAIPPRTTSWPPRIQPRRRVRTGRGQLATLSDHEFAGRRTTPGVTLRQPLRRRHLARRHDRCTVALRC